MKTKSNPIAEQSKKWLMDALLRLMTEKPYSEITISELSDKAQLARRTFYRNFESKEEVLDLYMEKLFEEYVRYWSTETDFSLQNIALVYFRFWKEHLDTVRVFKKSDLLFLLLLKFNEYLPQIHRIVHQDTPEHWGEDELTYALIFSAGGFWNILNKWLEDGAVKTPEELAGIIQTALRNIR